MVTTCLHQKGSMCLQATVMISLLQPAEETYNLFDDVMLLSDGAISDHQNHHHLLMPLPLEFT